ncbi:MAG: Leucinerich repeat protein-like protein [Flavipsychrobacter sp.]|nr:Leucinerich repeat protein-like protein [Flavipsychrobacter sp.]
MYQLNEIQYFSNSFIKTNTMKKVYLPMVVAFILALAINSQAQIITTFAGNGTPAYGGDGGPAPSAKIYAPGGVCLDAAGNLYIADRNNQCIRKVTGGIISTIAGTGAIGYSGDGGPATNATFHDPIELTIDVAGNIYIGDANNNAVRKINTAGIISTVAGTGVAGYNGDGIAATSAKLFQPYGVCLDAAGNLYIGDFFNHRVRKVSTTGIISTFAGTGTAGYSSDGIAASTSKLNNPHMLWMDPSGNLIISDNANHRIRKVNTSGIISTIAGNGTPGYVMDGVPATSTGIYFPGGVAMDVAGNLYFAENGDARVRKIDVSGIISTIAGTGTGGFSGDGGAATLAKISGPTDVDVDGSGNIYIADCNNNRIRKINSTSNNKPYFTAGHTQSITICQDKTITPINTELKIMDLDNGQTETWSILTAPSHGLAIAAFTTISTGAAITPTGLSYTPAPGYSGTDLFKVIINDGTASDTTTINVIINPMPNAGIISGIDSVCPGGYQPLSETATGGLWSCSGLSISAVSGSGVVKGLTPGKDTIVYTVINSCGTASAIFPFKVRPYGSCPSLMTVGGAESNGISVYPNPNSGNFTVEIRTANEEQARMNIVNILGQHVKDITIPSNKPTDIALDVPSGMYMLNATTSGQQWSKKIMINTGR